MPLEECHLRLDDPDDAGRGIHRSQSQLPGARAGVGQSPLLEEERMRVDAEAQVPPLLEDPTQPRAEVRHATRPPATLAVARPDRGRSPAGSARRTPP